MSTPKRVPIFVIIKSYYMNWPSYQFLLQQHTSQVSLKKNLMLFCVIIILTVIFYLLYIFVVWMKKNISNMKNFLKIQSLDWIWCGNSDDAKICLGLEPLRTYAYVHILYLPYYMSQQYCWWILVHSVLQLSPNYPVSNLIFF